MEGVKGVCVFGFIDTNKLIFQLSSDFLVSLAPSAMGKTGHLMPQER